MSGCKPATLLNELMTWPPARSASDAPVPLYCTTMKSIFAICFSNSAARCEGCPAPEADITSWPGLARARAMKSLTFFAGSDACTASRL